MGQRPSHEEESDCKGRVDIRGIPKAKLLAALYLHATYLRDEAVDSDTMESMNNLRTQSQVEQAAARFIAKVEIMELGIHVFDVKLGCGVRCLFVDITGDFVDPTRYDERHGHGLVQTVVNGLRSSNNRIKREV